MVLHVHKELTDRGVAKGGPGAWPGTCPANPILFFARTVGDHTVNTDSISLCYVFIVLIMFSQHSKSIFMNLKPIISFVEQTQRY